MGLGTLCCLSFKEENNTHLGSCSFWNNQSVDLTFGADSVINMPVSLVQEMPTEPPESLANRLSRYADNTQAIVGRNVATVALPALIREITRGILAGSLPAWISQHLPYAGAVAAYLPCAAQLYGLYRDIETRTSTRYTIIGRSICMVVPGIVTTVVVATGGLETVAIGLIVSNFIYAPLRDAGQNYFRREDELELSRQQTRQSAYLSAGLNIPNKAMSNIAMPHATELGSILNIIAPAALDTIRESIDDGITLGTQTNITDKSLNASLRFSSSSEHTWNQVLDRVLNTTIGRCATSSTVSGASYLSNYAFPDARLPGLPVTIQSIVETITSILAYIPYIWASEHTDPRREYNPNLNRERQSGDTVLYPPE